MEDGALPIVGAGLGINRSTLGARVVLRVGVGVPVGFGKRQGTWDACCTPSGAGLGWWDGSYAVIRGF